jgi:hypothetical protein
MNKSSHLHDLKTAGLTPFTIHNDQALFRVKSGAPLLSALSHVSDLLHLSKPLAEDAAMDRGTDRYAWASHYLQEMSKAAINDAVKVLGIPDAHPPSNHHGPRVLSVLLVPALGICADTQAPRH